MRQTKLTVLRRHGWQNLPYDGMPKSRSAVAGLLLCCNLAVAAEIPDWAYPVDGPEVPSTLPASQLRYVPDSVRAFTVDQLAAISGPVCDWHPDGHPSMPVIVSRGRPPAVFACAYCHLPNGAGRPENASLAGLSPAYIREQLLAFQRGDRPGSEPKRAPQTLMEALAKSLTAGEAAAAADYFSSLKPESFVTVIETGTVPRTVVAGWMLARSPAGGTEPIRHRIVELADDSTRFENRDSRTPYVAYVPAGSLARGLALVSTGGGKTVICAICHGPGLKGLADVPRLAGRSPDFLFRQLHDIRSGTRTGKSVELMKAVVAPLNDDDMLVIAAYLASLKP
jgi:cytochrome c553